MLCLSDFTDALFNPTKGSEKTSKTPKEVIYSAFIFSDLHTYGVVISLLTPQKHCHLVRL